MNSEIKAHVIDLLETYHKRDQQIALLRYEMTHPPCVAPDDMIDAMSYVRGDGIGDSGGRISNKTLYIALNYQERAYRANARNRMGCDENWYNSYYAISHTFSRDEIEAMSETEVSNLIKLGDTIAEYLY